MSMRYEGIIRAAIFCILDVALLATMSLGCQKPLGLRQPESARSCMSLCFKGAKRGIQVVRSDNGLLRRGLQLDL